MLVDSGKKQIAYLCGGSIVQINTGSWWVAIGTGSAAVTSSRTLLNTENTRNPVTGSADTSVANKVTWIADFNATTMSGLQLKEFSLTPSSSTGSNAWIIEGFNNVSFGTNQELQIQISMRTF